MKALRVPVESLESGDFELDQDATHYVLRVHRLQAGATLLLCDVRRGLEASASLLSASKKRALCRVEPIRTAAAVPTRATTLLQGLAKGDKLDRVIRDATALGVTRILLVATERSVVRFEGEGADVRLLRWRRIAVEAARQCGRGNIPEISDPMPLGASLEHAADARLRFMLSPAAEHSLAKALAERPPQSAALLIGPEGGLASNEERASSAAGFQPVRFGQFTLRTETAATAVLGALVAWRAREP